MSGNQPPDPPDPNASFPAIGQYDLVPGPGEEGYVDPDADDLATDDAEETELGDLPDNDDAAAAGELDG